MRFQWKNALGAAAVAAALCGFVSPPAARAQAAVSVSFFHQQLAPHGQWVVAGSYGNCWVPGGVAAGWAPYVDGQWANTDYGWTWNSSDPWGDITYHYGTWAWVPPYGWVWVPGTVWAPAWVTWAYTDDFIGWAPVPPSFVFSFGGYVGGPVVVAQTQYVFVPSRQFVGVPVNTVRVAAPQNAAIFRRATKVTAFPVSNGVVRTAGLPEARVEKAMGHRIERVPIRTQAVPLSRAGFENAKSIPVVAPKAERAREIKAQSAPPESRDARTANANKAQAQARPSHEAKPAPQRNAPPEQKQVQHKKAQPKPEAENPPTETHQAQHRNPPSKPKAKPQPQPEARQPEQPQQQPAPRPNPEARPDGSPPDHEARSAQPKPHPVQKQKPQPKPQPEREKPQGSDKPDQK